MAKLDVVQHFLLLSSELTLSSLVLSKLTDFVVLLLQPTDELHTTLASVGKSGNHTTNWL
jgi:hypothetical protein